MGKHSFQWMEKMVVQASEKLFLIDSDYDKLQDIKML